MSTDNLNFTGQVVLTGAASLAVNGVSHPLSTIQTCMQARPRSIIPWVTIQKQISFLGFNRQFNPPLHVPLLGLYRGFTAIYAVEAFSFATAYVTNDLFKTQFGPIGAIFAAAAVSTPFIGVGEGAMQNRQSNNLSYQDKELWHRSTRVSGLIVTMQREVFWNLGIFYVTPKVTAEIRRRFPECPAWASQIFGATATGALIGFVTTPIAGIKTVIQTSRKISRSCRLSEKSPDLRGPSETYLREGPLA
jgi:hypothetical protein